MNTLESKEAKFCIGQCVFDPQFRYRGVIVDVDYCYTGTDDWYKEKAPHCPPKNEPWYHILVHNSGFRVYTAESSLEPDLSGEVINHPEIDYFFAEFKNGVYVLRAGHDM